MAFMLLWRERPGGVEMSKMAAVGEVEDGRGKWVGERDKEKSRLSTLEDGLAQTHTLPHLPAEQTARSSDASRSAETIGF
ncbi:hypothetical protein KCU73_g10815, partial [Aureobasidium melanogenum]